VQTFTTYLVIERDGITQFGVFNTWQDARAQQLALAEQEIFTEIQAVEEDAPPSDEPVEFRENLPGEDMGRFNAWLKAA